MLEKVDVLRLLLEHQRRTIKTSVTIRILSLRRGLITICGGCFCFITLKMSPLAQYPSPPPCTNIQSQFCCKHVNKSEPHDLTQGVCSTAHKKKEKRNPLRLFNSVWGVTPFPLSLSPSPLRRRIVKKSDVEFFDCVLNMWWRCWRPDLHIYPLYYASLSTTRDPT